MTRSSSACSRQGGEKRSTLRSWSDLPDGPLETILTCLCSLVDFISFSSVCRSWRAVASSLPPSLITSLFPPLFISPTDTDDDGYCSNIRLLDPASSFSSSLTLSKFNPFRYRYHYHGCLFRFSKSYDRIVILNPLTGDEIFSPVLPYNPRVRYAPPPFTSPLSSLDPILLLFVHDVLLYWHIRSPKHYAWSSHRLRIKFTNEVRIATVQGKVYVMDSLESLFVLDLSPELHLRPLAVEGIVEMQGRIFYPRCYLVECSGELLCLMFIPREGPMPAPGARLQVFQLDTSLDKTRWVKKKTLGNWAIFVGCDISARGLAVENPERGEGKGILFTLLTGTETVTNLGR